MIPLNKHTHTHTHNTHTTHTHTHTHTHTYLELFLEATDPLARDDLGQPLNLHLEGWGCNVSLATRDQLTQGIVDEHILRLWGRREGDTLREVEQVR